MTSIHDQPPPDDIDEPLFRKLCYRLIPVLLICYFVAIVDRVNIGFAKLEMSADIGLSAAAYGFGAGIFFLAYCLLEVPSNLMLERVGARVWITRILISWGIVTMATGFVRSPEQFYIVRILLGAAEAGFFPGMIFYLSKWFPKRRLGRALAVLMMASPAAIVILGPLSGWLMTRLGGVAGLAGWQWLFVVQGIPAVLMGLVFLQVMSDSPAQASWLTQSEKKALQLATVGGDAASTHPLHGLRTALTSGSVWLLGLIMATTYLGNYAVVFWLPTIVQDTGITNLISVGLLSAIPWLFATVALLIAGTYGDRSQRQRGLAAVCMLMAAAGLAVSVIARQELVPTLVGISIAAAFFSATGPLIWSIVQLNHPSAAAIALVNTVASCGSFLGPYIVGLGQEYTGSVGAPLLVIAATLVFGSLALRALSIPGYPSQHGALKPH